jgi:CRP/FNR family transcriptional regulator
MQALKGFRMLPAPERARLAAATRERCYERGTTVFSQGQVAESVWAVKEGLVHIVRFGASGRELGAEVIPPGELFGAIAALEKRPYPATAMTAEPSVVWSIPATLARELCQKYAALRVAILEQVAAACGVRTNACSRWRSSRPNSGWRASCSSWRARSANNAAGRRW